MSFLSAKSRESGSSNHNSEIYGKFSLWISILPSGKWVIQLDKDFGTYSNVAECFSVAKDNEGFIIPHAYIAPLFIEEIVDSGALFKFARLDRLRRLAVLASIKAFNSRLDSAPIKHSEHYVHALLHWMVGEGALLSREYSAAKKSLKMRKQRLKNSEFEEDSHEEDWNSDQQDKDYDSDHLDYDPLAEEEEEVVL
ncbi:MAG: hypothetical protein M1829_006266 [Trizodia sp. TS-e1964]|nr:MAG: hypothetical protein M1829_006266 [Trizodia sp. TS-e1964]